MEFLILFPSVSSSGVRQDADFLNLHTHHFTHHPGCVSIPFNTGMEGLDVVINHISIPRETMRIISLAVRWEVLICTEVLCDWLVYRERGSLTMWARAGRKWRMQDVWSQCLSCFPSTIFLETWQVAKKTPLS